MVRVGAGLHPEVERSAWRCSPPRGRTPRPGRCRSPPPARRDRSPRRPGTGVPRCRSRSSRVPRPSGSRRGRSGGCPRGRRAPRRAPGRAPARCPPRCGGRRSRGRPPRARRGRGRRGGPPRPAGGRRSPRPWCGSPAPAPSRSSLSSTSVSFVVRWISALLLTPGAPSTRRVRESPRRGPGRRRRARDGPPPRGQGYASHPAPEGRRGQRRLEARRAPGGKHVVGPGHVVAERRGRRPGPRTGSRRGARGPQGASASSPTSSRCSGAISSASRTAARASPASISWSSASWTLGRSGGQALHAPRPRRRAARDRARCTRAGCRRRARPGRAGPAPRARDRPRRSATTTSSLGPATPSIATCPADLALGLLHVRVARPGDHVHGAPRTRCRRPGRRSPALRPSGTPRSPRRARRRRGSPGAARPPGPGGAQTAISSTPAARAVTAHITTVDGYGARPPGT